MPTRNGSSSSNSLRSDSGPYGGADYRAAEAKRSGAGKADISMADIRGQLVDELSQKAGFPDASAEIKKKVSSKPDELMDDFNSDFGASKYNPYYTFQLGRVKDVYTDTIGRLNTAVAYRDLMEARGATKEQIKDIDYAIERYAMGADELIQHFDSAESRYPYGNIAGGYESTAEEIAKERKVIDLHNEYGLYLKNAIQDAIIPSKRGPRNG